MANLKIKVIDPKKLIFALEEPGQIGDTICLKDLNAIDFSEWNQEVVNSENQEIKNKIQSEAERIELKVKDQYNDEIVKLKSQIQQLNNEKELINKTNEQNKQNALSELINKKDNEINQLKQVYTQELNKTKNDTLLKIQNLENENANLKNSFNEKLTGEISKKEVEFIKKENDIKNQANEKIQAKDQEINNYKNEINNLNDKLENLKREKNLLSTKALGEELEQWCYNEYHSIMGNVAEDCSFEKANTIYDSEGNKSRTGNKADFIFNVYDRPVCEQDKILIGTVTLEMKTGTENADKKNNSFLPKLHHDMLNTKADYGILVTELEPDMPIVINKAQGYNNIFIVRPNSMVALLTILRSVILKQKEVKRQEILFRDSIDIINEWNDFKNDLFTKTIDKINTNLEQIQKSVDTARGALDNIQKARDTIFNTHIHTVQNKIEKFNIKKLGKSIDKVLESSQENKRLVSDQALSESEEAIVKEHKQLK